MNLNAQEKSRGVVVFAFNTQVDYVAIADQTSKLIQHFLGLPITLITDYNSSPKFAYDQVIRIDNQGDTWRDENTRWRNVGRHLAYLLTPYRETVLLDTDYVVLDNSLLKLFDTDFDYRLHYHNITADGASYEQMGETSIPFIWATVVLFRKSVRAHILFDLVGRIQRNYQYYRALYNIREGNFRNDYAFAIANVILNGYTIDLANSIPWPMFTIVESVEDLTYSDQQIRVYQNNRGLILPYQNVHIMDKHYLGSENFELFVEGVCEPA
jgi:hypothetical protein